MITYNGKKEIEITQQKIQTLYLLVQPLSKAKVVITKRFKSFYLKVYVGSVGTLLIKEKCNSLDKCFEYICHYINSNVSFRLSEYNKILLNLDDRIFKIIEQRNCFRKEFTSYVKTLKENSYRKVDTYEP